MRGMASSSTRRFTSAAGVGLVVLWLLAGGVSPWAQTAAGSDACAITTSERIVAVGDVHGAYDRFVAILREAGIVDGRARWRGGRTVLVQTGDLLDRGPDSRRVLDLVRRLEREAERAGGQVHALLGNHEVMRMVGDFRYVSAGEYEAFRSRDADELRERYYAARVAAAREQAATETVDFDESAFRTRFLDQTPLGLIETVLAFAPTADYGRWLRQRDTMVVINGIAFVHGGISPGVAPLGCAGINARVRAELQPADPPQATEPDTEPLVTSAEGPLWYRGLADGSDGLTAEQVSAILEAIGARRMVVGHTAASDYRVFVAQDGRLIGIDTGMLGGTFYQGGVASALEIQDGVFTAIYVGRRDVLAVEKDDMKR